MTATKHTKQLLAAATLLLTLALTISNSLIHPAGTEESRNVIIQDFAFHPQKLIIAKGDTVNWTNNDSVIYTLWFVLAENESTYLLSNPIPPDQSWVHAFTELEKFPLFYYDFERLWISGTIKVYMVIGDVDSDGDVDAHDLYLFAKAYGTTPPTNPDCDLDFDEDVDPDDIQIFAEEYGKTDP